MRFFLYLFLILNLSIACAEPTVQLDLFVASTCSHCQKAEIFLKQQSTELPWLHMNIHTINTDIKALEDFSQRLSGLKNANFAIPALFFCGSHWSGFDVAETSGKKIMDALRYCKVHQNPDGIIPPLTQQLLQQRADSASLSITMQIHEYSALQRLMLAALDGINACSLFFFVVFIAALSRETTVLNQYKIGVSLILASALMLYLKQNYSEFYLSLNVWLRIPSFIIGLLMAIYLYVHEKTSAFYILLTFLFGASIIFYQQTCALPLLHVSKDWIGSNLLKQGLYILFYILPITLGFFLYILLSQTAKIKRRQPQLKAMASYILIGIALYLIFYPAAIVNSYFTLGLIPFALFGWYWEKSHVE